MVAAHLKDLFRQHGFPPVKAELWSEFVQHVLAIFRSAADELRRPDNWENFKRKKGALGRPRARNRRRAAEGIPIEDAITSELAVFVRRIRRALPIGHFLRLNEVEFHVEDLVPSDARAGRHSRKVDFLVCTATGENEPELAIEAKPLIARADIAGRYLAEEGIGCFFTVDSPYTLGSLGGMLACTINDRGRSWRAEVRAAMGAYQPPVLQLDDAVIAGEPEPLRILVTSARRWA